MYLENKWKTHESGNTSNKKLTRLVSSSLFVRFKAFEGGITAVHMLKKYSHSEYADICGTSDS